MRRPNRVRLRRRKGWRLPKNARSVARPSKWGNPHKVKGSVTRVAAIRLYRAHLHENPELAEAARRELAGRDLACWCPLDEPCHADVLLELANIA
ncbi:DUF4326 domain-containing protein [Candidatus Palauibacter sp.]|uniref:DUF4326 domain-containing protein n=1 Tax=Candidatus Palauibacter sp. TaxID=3101350 RepID=UPI003CC6544A